MLNAEVATYRAESSGVIACVSTVRQKFKVREEKESAAARYLTLSGLVIRKVRLNRRKMPKHHISSLPAGVRSLLPIELALMIEEVRTVPSGVARIWCAGT